MDISVFRQAFRTHCGEEGANKFSSAFLHSFPFKQRLYFWQEQMLDGLCKAHGLPYPEPEALPALFNFCAIHGDDLLPDRVPIFYGTFMPASEEDKRRSARHPYARAWFKGAC